MGRKIRPLASLDESPLTVTSSKLLRVLGGYRHPVHRACRRLETFTRIMLSEALSNRNLLGFEALHGS
jgi:hypothetical protein